jgi:peptidoglycan/xylan/chitin deacetylase (PgdA/CDA1 family)
VDIKYDLTWASGIPQLINHFYRFRPLIIAYHGIYDGNKNLEDIPSTFVHLSDFEKQIQFLRSRYRFIDPREFLTVLRTGAKFPASTALLTFDDGYESFFRLATPVLKKYQIKPIVFLSSIYLQDYKPFWFDIAWIFFKHVDLNFIEDISITYHVNFEPDNRSDIIATWMDKLKRMLPEKRIEIISLITTEMARDEELAKLNLQLFYPMTPEQIKTLAKQDVSFGGHTHTILSTLSIEQVEEEIRVNKSVIEELIDDRLNFFAYPNGKAGDFNKTTKEILIDYQYQTAFSLTNQRSKPAADPLEISRINVSPSDSVSSLKFHATGISRYIGKVKGYI